MAKPEIRLKGFKGEWENLKIGELSDILTGYPFEGPTIRKNGKYLLMRGINITEGFIRHSDDIDRYFDGDITGLKKYELRTNDLVIGMDGSKVGKNSALVTERENGSLLVQRVARLRNNNININRLIQIALRSAKFMQYVEGIKTSSAIPHISPSDIYNFEISLSNNLEEQRSIADYFKSLDSMIQGVTKKIASLKQMKQACLVSMFPQAGETKPRVRFKGFKGEWEEKRLSDCLDISTERNFDNKFGKEDVLSVSDDFGVMNQIELLGRSYAGKSVSNYGILKTGEIVYTKSPLKSKPFGIVKQNTGKTGIVSVLYAVYMAKEGTAADYIHYYFDPDWRLNDYLRPLVNKGAKNTMNISDEMALTGYIMIPKDINEQLKIASYFRSLDKQISLQEARLEKLKQIKAACLDKMFV